MRFHLWKFINENVSCLLVKNLDQISWSKKASFTRVQFFGGLFTKSLFVNATFEEMQETCILRRTNRRWLKCMESAVLIRGYWACWKVGRNWKTLNCRILPLLNQDVQVTLTDDPDTGVSDILTQFLDTELWNSEERFCARSVL